MKAKTMYFLVAFLHFVFLTMRLEAQGSVLIWNKYATRASQESQESLPFAARALAILHTAIYDTIQAIEPKRRFLYAKPELLPAKEGPINMDVAVTAAAHAVLTKLYPHMAHQFDEELLHVYAGIPDTPEKQQGIAIGREVAFQVLAWRARDGESAQLSLKKIEGTAGHWSPEGSTKPLVPYWSTQPFFAIESAQVFRVPPPLHSADAQYVEDYYYAKRLGHYNAHERLTDHTAQGLFWDHATVNPVVYWNGVARLVAADKNLSDAQAAHLLALLNVAFADSVMSSWSSKYQYRIWRPEEAIHRAKELTDVSLLVDKDWKPLLSTPPYPDYPSAHSACAGAASVVLQGYVGDAYSFTCTSCGEKPIPGKKVPVRSYKNFSTAAKEAAEARVYAGVCFPSSTTAGMELGKRVAYYVLEHSTEKIKPPPS